MRMMRSIQLMALTVATMAGLTTTAVHGQQQTFPLATAPTPGSTFSYVFAANTTPFTPITGTYNAPTSGTFTLRVYMTSNAIGAAFIGTPQQGTLSDPADPTSAPVYIANSGTGQGGIPGAGVRATYGTGTTANPNNGTPGVISVLAASSIGLNNDTSGNTTTGQQTGFNDAVTGNGTRAITPSSGGNNYAQFIATTDFNTLSCLSPNANGANGIYLGRFTFTVQGAAGSTTNLKAEDIPVLDSFKLKSGFNLDSYITPANLTVVIGSAVPEPASLLGVAGLGLLAVRRLRRKA